jgi:hypothetical protein
VSAFGLLVLVVACTKTTTKVIDGEEIDAGHEGGSGVSTKPSSSGAPVGDDDDDDSTTSSSSSSSGSTSSSSSGGTPTVADCHAKATQKTCGDCCQQISQAGFQVYAKAQHDCGCEAQYCADTCKTSYCAATPANPTPDCLTCFNQHLQDCSGTVNTACNANADCKVFNNCLQTACAGLPTQ